MLFIDAEKRESVFRGPLEGTNIFPPSNKVSSYEKLLQKSCICFLILFVLKVAILLNLDFQKIPNCYKQNFVLGTIHMGSQSQKKVQSPTRNHLTVFFSIQMRSVMGFLKV